MIFKTVCFPIFKLSICKHGLYFIYVTDIVNGFHFLFTESVSFELDNTQEIVDHQFLNLVTKCKKLKELSINALISMQTVETLCEMVRERKCCMYSLLILTLKLKSIRPTF